MRCCIRRHSDFGAPRTRYHSNDSLSVPASYMMLRAAAGAVAWRPLRAVQKDCAQCRRWRDWRAPDMEAGMNPATLQQDKLV